jgi:poly(3-hydroxybutyrate) depolymerase
MQSAFPTSTVSLPAAMPAILRIRARSLALLLACVVALPLSCLGSPPRGLPALNVDIAETSLSGISSGAFMAVQFEIAHSSIVKGVGVVAGGPYFCSQGSAIGATTRCSCTLDPAHLVCGVSATSADVPALERATRSFAADQLIDNAGHIASQRVFILAGGRDPIVPAAMAAQTADYYSRFSMPAHNISTKLLDNAGHTMPTLTYGRGCSVTDSPYIGKCGFDGAKAILSWILGPLKPPRHGALTGRFVEFDQSRYVRNTSFLWLTGMDTTGWVYIPAACAQGAACRLHIALHGCQQGQSYLPLKSPPGGGLYYGTTFVRHAGYAAWADTNRIVVLFPQAVSIPGLNPNGCWDWWGYTDENYANRNGVQIAALRAMVDRIASGRH